MRLSKRGVNLHKIFFRSVLRIVRTFFMHYYFQLQCTVPFQFNNRHGKYGLQQRHPVYSCTKLTVNIILWPTTEFNFCCHKFHIFVINTIAMIWIQYRLNLSMRSKCLIDMKLEVINLTSRLTNFNDLPRNSVVQSCWINEHIW